MANYTGAKCEYCHNAFSANDDIVVCPECGTPYHRECYNEAGECVNKELHEKGGTWSAVTERENEGAEEKRCPRCGETNPPAGLFCVKCGYPLQITSEARPFNEPHTEQNPNNGPYGQFNGNQSGNGAPFGMPFQREQLTPESDLDGNKLGDYAKFVGGNPLYFINQFVRFVKAKTKVSVNFAALFFTEFYFFYRKMYKQGALFFVILTILSIPYVLVSIPYMLETAGLNLSISNVITSNADTFEFISNICSMLTCAVRVLAGLFANYWYYKKAKSSIDEVKLSDATEDEKNEAVVKSGGTSMPALLISFTAYFASVILILIAAVSL